MFAAPPVIVFIPLGFAGDYSLGGFVFFQESSGSDPHIVFELAAEKADVFIAADLCSLRNGVAPRTQKIAGIINFKLYAIFYRWNTKLFYK